MKTSQVLIRAKRHLPRDRLYGICYAVTAALHYGTPDEIRVCKMIGDRLSPHTMASTWLAAKVTGARARDYDAQRDWIFKQDPRDIQAWRHAWLDQMIAEFKAKGD